MLLKTTARLTMLTGVPDLVEMEDKAMAPRVKTKRAIQNPKHQEEKHPPAADAKSTDATKDVSSQIMYVTQIPRKTTARLTVLIGVPEQVEIILQLTQWRLVTLKPKHLEEKHPPAADAKSTDATKDVSSQIMYVTQIPRKTTARLTVLIGVPEQVEMVALGLTLPLYPKHQEEKHPPAADATNTDATPDVSFQIMSVTEMLLKTTARLIVLIGVPELEEQE